MNAEGFEVLALRITDTSQAPRGKDIYYQCTECGGVVPSVPDDSVGCECGNVSIDTDYHQLFIDDYSRFQLLRKPSRPWPARKRYDGVQLETDSGLVIDSPTDEDIDRALHSEGFALLRDGSDAYTYLQFAKKKGSPWDLVLEYQTNSLDNHFRASDMPLRMDDIVAAFQNYAAGREDWKMWFRWERIFLG